ncbi:MAG: hypothetical protein ACK4SF_05260 [Algoriphagus aquaeductus]|uniref:hypothetical protein n=1 Tax=Algoriphagus aquaeductus TaxID=475299 RepID=UPI00391D14AF
MFRMFLLPAFLFLCVFEVQAQFPTFYPTYRPDFKIYKNKDGYGDELKKALNAYIDTVSVGADQKDTLVLDVSTTYYLANLFYKRYQAFEIEVKGLELQIQNLYFNQTPDNESLKKAIDYNNQILKKRKEIKENKLLYNYLYSVNRYFGAPGVTARFFPVINRYQGNFFYNNVSSSGISTLNSFVIQASENGGAANAEIVSGQIAAVRVSISSVIQGGGNAIDSLEVNTKLFNGGGITNLHFELPFFYYNRQNILFYSAFKPGFVADIPVFGSELEREAFSGYADLAGEFLVELRTDGGEFSLFANFKGSHIRGTEAFYNTLKSPDSNAPLGQVDKPFWISQVYVGVSVSKRFRISANIPIATTSQIQLPDKIQIGLQIMPDKIK